MEQLACFKCEVHSKTEQEEQFLKKALGKHILFQELTGTELHTLVMATQKLEVEPGARVQAQDTLGEYMFVVQSGELSLYCERKKTTYAKIKVGQIYGETDLLYGVPTAQALIADKKSTIWKLGQMTYRQVVAKHALEMDSDIKAALRKVKLFDGLPVPTLNKFADTLTRVHYKKGDKIIEKGEIGHIFYIIEKGKVKVHDIGIGDSQQVDSILEPGDSFGERALITGEPRAASITALSERVTLLVMNRVTFEETIGELEDALDFSNRLHSMKGLSIFAGSDLTEHEFERLADLVVKKTYSKGTKLVKAGSPYPPMLWMLQSGTVIVYGRSDHIYSMGAGDYLGDKSILNAKEHISSHDATCETEVTAYVLTREDVESIVVDVGRLGRSSGFAMSKRISSIGMEDLKLYKILGQGAFGKVWLCTTMEGGQTPYALKVINKRALLAQKQHRGVLREKEMLSMLNHPFILYLVSSFQDKNNLYLLLPLIQGGELFGVVSQRARRGRGIPKFEAAFYGAGIMEALGHFHHRYIAYRDLKLENCMIDAEGYIKIVDLGFAKIIVDKSYTFCGTPDYLAPEIIMAKGHNHAVDYWSFGVLMFELLVGRSPFSAPNQPQMKMFKRIVLVQYEFPMFMERLGNDLISKLLVRPVSARLGAQKNGSRAIRNHEFFLSNGIDSRSILKKEIQAPWIPEVKDPLDSHHFQDFSAIEKEKATGSPLTDQEQALFDQF
ncbi:serine/threonine protein kinase [Nitzschia inconspicua]|uniref:cGMP-dependent protein kinase n=1 Tax=Nitzschia inconspicua TaxID=303405 RepID=A0A9K3M1H5_9STRA|nr:serine/threonine protein kinase [Nitzschia inconspicua]